MRWQPRHVDNPPRVGRASSRAVPQVHQGPLVSSLAPPAAAGPADTAALRLKLLPTALAANFRAVNQSAARTKAASAPLWLLVRINGLQAWRRLLSIRHQSRLMTAVIGLFIGGYLWLSFWLFYRGLEFVAKFPGLGVVLTERLLYVLFAFLFALLLLSNLVISYSNFFRNRETAFLLTMPVSMQTILRWKFIESTLLASWAFLFLIAPLLAAFGLVRGVPWHFYVLTVGLTALFIVLPGVAGVWVAMTVARFLDRRTFQVAVVVVTAVLLAGAAFLWRT